MKLEHIFFILIIIFLIPVFSLSVHSLHDGNCFVVENGCGTDTNISEPGFCNYSINPDVFTEGTEEVEINIIQGGMYNSDRDTTMHMDENTGNTNFSVWVDKKTQPTYILCRRVDTSGSKPWVYMVEQIVLGSSDTNINAKKDYQVLTKDDSELYFISFGLIIISLFSMFLLAMNRRKK